MEKIEYVVVERVGKKYIIDEVKVDKVNGL